MPALGWISVLRQNGEPHLAGGPMTALAWISVLQPDEARHSAGDPVAAIRKKTLLARRAESAAVDLRDTAFGELPARNLVEIGQELSIRLLRKRRRCFRVPFDERLPELRPDLVGERSDSRPQVSQHFPRGHAHFSHRRLENSGG